MAKYMTQRPKGRRVKNRNPRLIILAAIFISALIYLTLKGVI